jgi:uncharacterized protein YegP (UPF0339 family)
LRSIFSITQQAPNGQIILTSSPRSFASEEAARAAVAVVTSSAANAANFVAKAGGGGPYFVLQADGANIGYSEAYSSSAARDAGIASVQLFAATSVVALVPWTPPATSSGATTAATTQPPQDYTDAPFVEPTTPPTEAPTSYDVPSDTPADYAPPTSYVEPTYVVPSSPVPTTDDTDADAYRRDTSTDPSSAPVSAASASLLLVCSALIAAL